MGILKKLKKRLGWKRAQVATAPPVVPLEQIVPDATEAQLETIRQVQPFTMTSPERILALCNAVQYVVENQIQGSFVECGVWRGGSIAAAARTLQRLGDVDRDLWLYDTFEGMSEPTDQDVDCWGYDAETLLTEQDRSDAKSVWCVSALQEVKNVMAETSYPANRVNYVEGRVEETLPGNKPEKIALLRLDTDWYESTKCELEELFPRLQPGGVLIIDDYGHWQGCRKAVDEYFTNHSINIFLNRIDYTGRIGIKMPGSTHHKNLSSLSHVA